MAGRASVEIVKTPQMPYPQFETKPLASIPRKSCLEDRHGQDIFGVR
jgi:hypothetical protein